MPTARFQPSFAAGVIGPGLHGRIDIAKYDVALKVGENVFVHAHGGVSNRCGLEFICPVMDHSKVHRLLPFQRDEDENYVMLMGDEEMKIIEAGAVVQDGGSDYLASTPYSSAQIPDVDYVQSIDVMFMAHGDVFPQEMSRTGLTDWTFANLQIDPSFDLDDWLEVPAGEIPENLTLVCVNPSGAVKFTDYQYVVTAVSGVDESYASSAAFAKGASPSNLAGNGGYMRLTWDAVTGADSYNIYRWNGSRYGLVGDTTSTTYDDVPTSSLGTEQPPEILSVTPGASGSETYRYVISPVIDGVEGFPSTPAETTAAQLLSISGAQNTITWSGSAPQYNVYRERSGVFGYIGFTDGNEFIDDNISPDMGTTPVEFSNLFTTADDYPKHITLFQQRLALANSANQPETMWMSRTGNFKNFTRSRILRDTDRIEMDLTGSQINRIHSMLQLRELLVFASAGEFSVTGPNGVMLATNPIQTQYGYAGASKVRPLVVDDTALFVDRTGRTVRDLRYAFEQDGYTGNDLTIFASHFFAGREIKGWAYAKNPFSIIWVYLDDGTLLSLTYKREHQVWAWCTHDIGGAVESMAVIPEGQEDALYLIVNRTIGGQTKRYVERMHARDFDEDSPEDAFFVDSGITYEGSAATVISGLDHLEGETVVALADGDVVEGLVVSSGSVTLPRAASKVHVGLSFVAEIETLPPAIELPDVGAARGRPIKASRLFLQLEKTRGIEVSTSGRGRFNKFTQTGGDLSAAIELFTGMISLELFPDWNKDGTIVARQPYPLPMTVLGLSPDLSVGR